MRASRVALAAAVGLVTALSLLLPGIASASSILVIFRAEITHVPTLPDLGGLDDPLHEAFESGQEISGWFRFDSDAEVTYTLSRPDRNEDKSYTGAISDYAVLHESGSGHFDNGGIRVVDDRLFPEAPPEEQVQDSFIANARTDMQDVLPTVVTSTFSVTNWVLAEVRMDLYDNSGEAFSDASLPESTPEAGIGFFEVGFRYEPGTTKRRIRSEITELLFVPEPSTGLFIGLGLAGVSLRRRLAA